MVELDMKLYLGNLSVNIYLWSKKEKQFKEITALFDTGAHTTHIDTGILTRLGYDLYNSEASYINTVGSSNIRINNTVIDNIKIGNFETGAVLVNFSELTNVNFPIIIGLNIIKEFNVALDFKNMKMLLDPNFNTDYKIPVEDFSKYSSRFGMWTISIDK